jgi:hypothetical protein
VRAPLIAPESLGGDHVRFVVFVELARMPAFQYLAARVIADNDEAQCGQLVIGKRVGAVLYVRA